MTSEVFSFALSCFHRWPFFFFFHFVIPQYLQEWMLRKAVLRVLE